MTCSPLALIAEAGCFNCLTPGQMNQAMLVLLCNLISAIQNIGGNAMNIGGNGDPNGVYDGALNLLYVQHDAPGKVWVKLTAAGDNTGWALVG